MKTGYLGLVKPYEAIYKTGQKVLINPNGKIKDLSTGETIREGKGETKEESSKLKKTLAIAGATSLIGAVIFSLVKK